MTDYYNTSYPPAILHLPEPRVKLGRWVIGAGGAAADGEAVIGAGSLELNVTDNDGTDWSTDLANVKVGDRLSLDVVGTSRNVVYEVTAIQHSGPHYTFTTTERNANGAPPGPAEEVKITVRVTAAASAADEPDPEPVPPASPRRKKAKPS